MSVGASALAEHGTRQRHKPIETAHQQVSYTCEAVVTSRFIVLGYSVLI